MKTKIVFLFCLFQVLNAFAKTDYKQEFKKAIDKNDTGRITKLIKKCYETDKTEALLYAVTNEKKDIVLLFLDSGVDVNRGNSVYKSPLIAAFSNSSDKELPDILIERGADINARINNKNETLLHFAVKKQDLPLTDWLIEKGINIYAENTDVETVLDYSVNNNNIILTRKFLEYKDLKIKDYTILKAIQNGNDEIIKILFESYPQRFSYKSDDFVISAVNENQKEILKVLLEHGCNANAKSANSISALYLASVIKQDYEMTNSLIKAGADVNEIYNEHTLLYSIRKNETSSTEITKLLTDFGAKLTATEENDLKYERYSPRDMNKLRHENIFKYDQKINGKIFWIEGRVAGTRNSFWGDEYIIKLEDSTENSFGERDSVDVVIPKYTVDEETLIKLGNLEEGNVISILVKGRSGTSYVDILLEKKQ